MSDYYEDEWHEDEDYDQLWSELMAREGEDAQEDEYSQLEQDCRFCHGPCGNCESVHAELEALSDDERAAAIRVRDELMQAATIYNIGIEFFEAETFDFTDLDVSGGPNPFADSQNEDPASS